MPEIILPNECSGFTYPLVKARNTRNLLEKQWMHICFTQQFLADYNGYLNTLSDVKGIFKVHPLS